MSNTKKVGVSLKIDVSKIDKQRLFNGSKGVYLDATVFIDLDQLDQYGNSGMITQDVSKDEKAQGVQGAILGNCKVFWRENGQQQATQGGFQQQAPQQGYQQPSQQLAAKRQQAQQVQQQGAAMDFDDDVPFAPIGLQYNNLFMHCV